MNLFQGNWRNAAVDRRQSVSDPEMEKVFEEIDHDLGTRNFSNENGSSSRGRRKSSGKPLILAPPSIKSFEEKTRTSKSRFNFEETYDDESSDQTESSESPLDKDEEFKLDESSDESAENESISEISSFQEEDESSSWFLASEESEEEPILDDGYDESYEYHYESPESFESSGTDTEPMNLATAAYRGTDYHTSRTKVRLPLQLAEVGLEVDIFDTFNLSRPIASVTNVECSLHSIDAEVLLPSANLFTKGILLLTIDYVSTNDTGTMHSIKIHIPWKKIIPVKWIHKPELSSKDSKEYMFTSAHGNEMGFTREYSENLVEKVDFNLSSLHCVWNEQFIHNGRVMVQGTANMKIDLFQNQCLDLDKLLSK